MRGFVSGHGFSRAGVLSRVCHSERREGPAFSWTQWNWWSFTPLALAVVAVSVPILDSHSPAFALALQRGFAIVCHQQPDRSFSLFGGSVAVCARCLGIYCGAVLGLLLHVPRRVAIQFLVAAVAVNAADSLAELVGLHGNWMVARFILGITLGTAAATFVIASLETRPAPDNLSSRSAASRICQTDQAQS